MMMMMRVMTCTEVTQSCFDILQSFNSLPSESHSSRTLHLYIYCLLHPHQLLVCEIGNYFGGSSSPVFHVTFPSFLPPFQSILPILSPRIQLGSLGAPCGLWGCKKRALSFS